MKSQNVIIQNDPLKSLTYRSHTLINNHKAVSKHQIQAATDSSSLQVLAGREKQATTQSTGSKSGSLEGRVGGWRESGRLIIQAAASAAALHLDIIEEECGFALDNGLKEGTSALAGGRALW